MLKTVLGYVPELNRAGAISVININDADSGRDI
jgi:hypothetical protein